MKTQENNYSHFGIKDEDQVAYAEAMGKDPNTFKVESRKQAKLDGYYIGDRLLEGIDFIFTVNDDGTLSVETPKESQSYMDNLNEEKWLRMALDYAKSRDFFEGLDGLEDINLVMTNGDYNFEALTLPSPTVHGKVNLNDKLREEVKRFNDLI